MGANKIQKHNEKVMAKRQDKLVLSSSRLLGLMMWVEASHIPDTWIELQWSEGDDILPEGYWITHVVIQGGRSVICVDISDPNEVKEGLGRLAKILARYQVEQRESIDPPDCL